MFTIDLDLGVATGSKVKVGQLGVAVEGTGIVGDGLGVGAEDVSRDFKSRAASVSDASYVQRHKLAVANGVTVGGPAPEAVTGVDVGIGDAASIFGVINEAEAKGSI